MGEIQGTLFPLEFNRSVHVEARAERLTADAGAVLLREFMDRSGLTALLDEHLVDGRDAARTVHPFVELLRTELLRQAQGYADRRDVELLRDDPAFRLAVSSRRGQRPFRAGADGEPDGLCSQPTLSRLAAALGSLENRRGLATVLPAWAERRLRDRVQRRGEALPLGEITLDLDSLPIEVYGHPPGSAWNGHYRQRCYHPLVVRWAEEGDFLGGRLRTGRAHMADGGLRFVVPHVRWAKGLARTVWLRIDAGFPEPELLGDLEDEGIFYVARLRSNAALERLAAPYLKRPPGRPPRKGRVWTHELRYAAGSWKRERRVVLVVLERPDAQGHLFLDHFFLVTNAPAEEVDGEALLERYRGRGDAERDFGEWKNALDVHLSSTPRPKSHYRERPVESMARPLAGFRTNEANLLLSLLAANLLSAAQAMVRRASEERWSRERFRTLVLKCAGRATLSGGYVTLAVDRARAPLWTRFHETMRRLYPARGSPTDAPLPSAA